ncbi:hypothetical protein Tsp_15647 [Trichinella spiralis]|uniref:hypothetical protein n=1 Tax=Trichinella spiralis TaxID=6334 RepID=UPI0001EFEDFE|nr:hypothetical protein Tsp_15647 [Trichinella spiralis]
MRAPVRVQSRRLNETLVAQVTLVTPFAGVRTFVHDQRRLLGKMLVTANGFSPVCTRSCATIGYLNANCLPQKRHCQHDEDEDEEEINVESFVVGATTTMPLEKTPTSNKAALETDPSSCPTSAFPSFVSMNK